jgi:hypothetical protein
MLNYFNEPFTEIVLYIYSAIYYSICMSSCASLHYCLLQRYQMIVEILTYLYTIVSIALKNLMTPFNYRENSSVASENVILILHKIYSMEVEILEKLTELFSFSTMLGFALSAVYSVYTVFLSYKVFIDGEDALYEKALINIAWCLFLNFYPLLIIATCEYSESEVVTCIC